MKKLMIIWAILIPSVFVACENQKSGQTFVNLAFKVSNEKSGISTSAKGISGEGLWIDSAVIVLEKIKLLQDESNGGNSGRDGFNFRGPYLINLLTKESEPAIPPREITPGIYTGLQADLYVPPAPGYSIYVSGTYTLDEKWWRFFYTHSLEGVFKANNPAGFTIMPDSPNTIWIIIDVVELFAHVDFNKAVVANGNIIRINNESNRSLAKIIENNFQSASAITNENNDKKKNNHDDDDGDKEEEDDDDDHDDESDDDDDDDDDDDEGDEEEDDDDDEDDK